MIAFIVSKAPHFSSAMHILNPWTCPSQGAMHPKDAAGVPTPDSMAQQVHCIMRYGIAAGAITAGVLQGKTPLFDIWPGRASNCRLEWANGGHLDPSLLLFFFPAVHFGKCDLVSLDNV